MNTKIDIRWHNLEQSAAVEEDIKKRFSKLLSHTGDVTTARISIDQPHHPSRKPHAFRVLLEIQIPGATIIAQQPPNEQVPVEECLDIYSLIHHAFDAARRQTLEHNALQQGRSLQHASARQKGQTPDTEPVDTSAF